MATTLPKFLIKVPSETTRFRDLGKELREFGISIESILESFDYTGADPNTVLSRVAALEAWRAVAAAKITALENDNRKLGYAETIAQSSFSLAGATLTTLTGTTQTVVEVTVSVPTEVIISTRCVLLTGGGASQVGVNLTGATAFTTPTDDPSVGKASANSDSVAIGQMIRVLNPGTTYVRLAARAGSATTYRNPSILVERL